MFIQFSLYVSLAKLKFLFQLDQVIFFKYLLSDKIDDFTNCIKLTGIIVLPVITYYHFC